MKYFYTDTLAAAWMMKHHGFLLQDKETSDEVYDMTYDLMIEGDDFGKPLAKYYIHPDSVHLLEPQEGDISYMPINLPNIKPAIFIWNKETIEAFKELSKINGITNLCIGRIIMRNGLPFMWPETDPADLSDEQYHRAAGGIGE